MVCDIMYSRRLETRPSQKFHVNCPLTFDAPETKSFDRGNAEDRKFQLCKAAAVCDSVWQLLPS